MFILFYHTFLLLYHVTYGKISLSVFGNLTKKRTLPLGRVRLYDFQPPMTPKAEVTR